MCLPSAAQTYAFWRWPLIYLRRCRNRYGSRFTVYALDHPPLVLLSEPSDIRAIFTAATDVLHPGEGAAMLGPLVGGESFMLQEGERHRRIRKTLAPALREDVVQMHSEELAEIVRCQIAQWPRNTTFELSPKLRRLTLEAVLSTVAHLSGSVGNELQEPLCDHLLAMLSVTSSPVLPQPALRRGPGGRVWKRFLRRRTEVEALIYALIDERRRSPDIDRGDVLGRLLAARHSDDTPLSSEELRDNVMTMLISGHETTSTQLAWAFQLLAHNPAVLDRLIREIDSGESEEYLTATIQEVLRYRPVFLFTIPRAVARPVEIGNWSYSPPAHLLGCIYLLHSDPRFYVDPQEFRPERFLETQPQPELWLPWGGGRKRCMGLHLAMLEMKTVLRTVLSNLTVLPAARRMEYPRWRSVIVTPHAGCRVVLRPRPRSSAHIA